ncbi:PKD domain-containing protein [Nonomuraea sp. AD125B]|uniref:PKD domain-containing protein n=1 Tax=Nonomuraea sp. AD125B TaxID=3242897 RepID=UPI003526F10A
MTWLLSRALARRAAIPALAAMLSTLAVPAPASAAPTPSPATAAASADPPAKITDLGSLVGTGGTVTDVNNKGDVTWAVGDPHWDNGRPQARLSSAGSVTDLHALLGLDPSKDVSTPWEVSDDGSVVVTTYGYKDDVGQKVYLVKAGKITPLGKWAVAINDRGQVAGDHVRDPDGSELKLEAFKGQYVEASALNNSGSVVGWADMDPGAPTLLRAFRSRPGEPLDLDRDELEVPGAYKTRALAVNDKGEAAGYVDEKPWDIPIMWDKNGGSHKQDIPDAYGGQVEAINEAGVGVGMINIREDSGSYSAHAALYQGGVGTDLNTLLPPGSDWTLKDATGINDVGQIVGIGRPAGSDVDHAFLLDLGSQKVRIESLELDTVVYPSNNWVPVPERGTVEGNLVRATVTLHNPNDIPVRRTLEVVEDGTGKVVRDGRFEVTIPPKDTVTKRVSWDTTGLAWHDGQPSSNRSVTARVLKNIEDESKATKPIVIRPLPVVMVHGWNSSALTWSKYSAFLKSAHPLLTGKAAGTLSTGIKALPNLPTYPLPLNAAMLSQTIDEVRTAEGAHHVNLIAHSMGTTISREYIAREMKPVEDGKPVVRRLIAMGAPNAGSPCADKLVQFMQKANERIPWYPATWENTMEYMQHEFNPKTTNLKGVLFSNLVGTGKPLACGWRFGGDKVPEPDADVRNDGDRVVPAWSARHGVEDTPTMEIAHTSMTGSQEAFNDYVRPRLVSLLSDDLPGLRGAAAAAGEEKAEATAGGESSIFASLEATVEPGKTASVPVEVPEGTEFGVVGTLPETVGLALRDPSGKVAAQYAAGSEEAMEVVQGLSVDAPQAGAWKLEITNTGPEPVKAELGAWIVDNPVKVTATAEASQDGKVAVKAAVTDGGQPVAGVAVRAVLTLGDGTRKEVPLKDDGNSGDEAADDGRYGGVTEELADGSYPVTVVAGTGKGERSTLVPVTVAKPDTREFALKLSAGPGGSVSASPAQDTYPAGTKVKMTATPEEGYLPIAWVIDGQERGAGELTVTMDGPHTVEARFGAYKVTEIGALPGYTADRTEAVALNDRGQVAATVGTSGGDDRRAVRWEAGVFTDLGGLSCEGSGKARCPSGATGINEAGDVSGWAEKWENNGSWEHAVVYRGGSVTDLHPGHEPSTYSFAEDLNDNGQVLTAVDRWHDITYGYFGIWERSGFERIPDTPLRFFGGAVNDRGVVAGSVVKERDPRGNVVDREPAVHANGVTTLLEIPKCTTDEGAAVDVNAGGLLVGYGTCTADGNYTQHAYTWKDGQRTDLGEGSAVAVNDHGVVVGYHGAHDSARPAVWVDGARYHLDDLLPLPKCVGNVMPCMGVTSIADVNSSGQILVRGFVKDGTSQGDRSYLLTPSTPRADLEVTHKVSPAVLGPGATVTWTSTVTNKGSDTATGVQLDVVIPAAAEGAVCETSRGLCTPFKSGGGFRNTVKVLEPGWSATVTVTATIPSYVVDGVEIKTSATAHTVDVTDPARGNNKAEATVTVRHALNRTKLTFDDPVRIGATSLPLEVKLTNPGTADMPVTAVTTDGPFGQTNDCPVSPKKLAPGKSCTMWVTFSPTQLGAASGKLAVITDGDQPSYVMTLAGRGIESNADPVVGAPAGELTGVVGQPFTFTVPYTDGDTGDTHTAEIWWGAEWGDWEPRSEVKVTPNAGGGGGTVTVTGTFTAPTEGRALVIVTDNKGGYGVSEEGIHYVIEAPPAANIAPAATAGGDVKLTVNEKLQRAVTFSDPGSAAWTANVDYGDGTGPVAVTPKGGQISLEHLWATAGTYPVTVTVRDNGGLQTAAKFTATVVAGETPDQAPKVKLSGPGKVTEGGTWQATGSLTDPGSKAWTASVDYGDGTGPRPLPVEGEKLKLEHVFTDNGERTVTVRVTDDTGATGTAQLKVNAAGAAPVVKLAEPAAETVVVVGTPVTLKASFTDLGTADTHTAVWTVDGRKVAGALAEREGEGGTTRTHTFTKPGRHPVTVTVTDDDGAATSKKVYVLVQAKGAR